MRHLASGPRIAAVLSLLIALLVAACSGADGAGGADAPGGDVAGAASESISLGQPADGETVSIPFDVRIDASVPLGAPETGNHHAHLYFDTGTDSADYDIVYGDTAQVTRPLAPGEHTIIVALADADHSLAGPTGEITVTVGDGTGEGGGAPAPAGSTPPGDSAPPALPPGY